MGNQPEEKRSALEMIEDTLSTLSGYKLDLVTKKEHAQDEKELASIQDEINKVDSRITFLKVSRDSYKKQLEECKSEEEKRKLQKLMKTAIMIGMVNSNWQMIWDAQLQKQKEEEMLEKTLNQLFSEEPPKSKYRFVTREMVDTIKKSEEFRMMALSDPNRLLRAEKDMEAEYEHMIEQALLKYGMKKQQDFAENEKMLRKVFEQKNEFEMAAEFLTKEMKEKAGLIEEAGEQKYYQKLLENIVSLGAVTRKLQNDFVNGKSDFKQGNGYTRELWKEEKTVFSKLKEFGAKLVELSVKEEEKDKERFVKGGGDPAKYKVSKKVDDLMELCRITLQVEGILRPQIARDEILVKNNELRKKMEMWDVYKKLPTGVVQPVNAINEKADLELRAWAKIGRMEKMALIKGGLFAATCRWAQKDAQDILERTTSPESLNEKAKTEMMAKVASVVLHQLIENEATMKKDGSRPYADQIKNLTDRTQFDAMVKKLAKSEEFRKQYKNYIKDGKHRKGLLRFLAEDGEKVMARKLENVKELTPVMKK